MFIKGRYISIRELFVVLTLYCSPFPRPEKIYNVNEGIQYFRNSFEFPILLTRPPNKKHSRRGIYVCFE